MALLGAMAMTTSCKDEDTMAPGNPEIEFDGLPAHVYFGDNMPFRVRCSDDEVPLSTVKGMLYLDGELVATTTVRTKESGQWYEGTIPVPYLPYATGTKGKLKLVLQNINFTTTEQEYDFDLEYPQFPYLTLMLQDGTEYTMNRVSDHRYEVTDNFDQSIAGTIISPAYGENGRELQFAYSGGSVIAGGTTRISFRYLMDGVYTVYFDTFTYDFGPLGILAFGDQEFTQDVETPSLYTGEFYLTASQDLEADGLPALDDWYVDPDYFVMNDGKLFFNAFDGYYHITVDLAAQRLMAYKVDAAGNVENLGPNATGTLWLMGTGAGKPSFTKPDGSNMIGWVAANKQPFAPIGDKKFRMTFIAGKTMNPKSISLRVFQQGPSAWGTYYKPVDSGAAVTVTVDSELVEQRKQGSDYNIYLKSGVILEEGALYEMIVDLSEGNSKATLTFKKK